MPRYKVIAPGFWGGQMYGPEGKRRVLHTDMPFKKGKLPKWLAEMEPETAAQKKKREAESAADAMAAAERAENDEKMIADASFMGDGEASPTVEVL